jgi:acyl phosphate:glycerol-3-phosphate acyltransferase
MLPLLRLLHVFCVALWFGSVAFFTVAGVLIFDSFRKESELPAEKRPLWFPVPEALDRPSPGDGFPDPLRLEQGSRAAGVAVGGIFPVYYALQAGCGLVAVLTALALARHGEGAGHRWRSLLSLLALATVLGGWWLETRVAELREPRNTLTDRALASASPSPELLEEARQARADFLRWHAYSLVQNFATLLLVAGVTALVPALAAPGGRGR